MLHKLKAPTVPSKTKKIAAVLALAVLVGFLTLASLNHWNDTKNKKEALATEQRVAAQKVVDEQQAKLARAAKIEAAYKVLHTECTKGKALYENVLSVPQKKTHVKTAPDCGPAVLPV